MNENPGQDRNKRISRIEERFQRTSELTNRKLLEYIPALLLTNLSTLLLVSVDGLVAGNLVGSDALSSVNLFYPISIIIGLLSVLTASGISTCLSTRMGNNDREGILYAKNAALRTMILAALLVAVLQIPATYVIIASYHLSPEMQRLTWQYAIGIMIAAPFGLISTVGVYEMQILGKMKVLATLAIFEGCLNLLLDLLFVGAFDLGVAGAGLGTAGANIFRCTATVIYLAKKTDIYRSKKRARAEDYKDILSFGLPDTAHALMLALQNYCMIRIILVVFGDSGGVIKGVGAFCFSLVNVFISSLQGSFRPLAGLTAGADDRMGLRMLMRQCILLTTVVVGAMTLVLELFPAWFYMLHGVKVIPEGGLLSLRFDVLYLMFRGYNTLLRVYFANRRDSAFSTRLTLLGNITLPLFAFVLMRTCPAPYIWLSYLLTESLILIMNLLRYRAWLRKDAKESDSASTILYLTVAPEDAAEASAEIQRYADEHSVPQRIANLVGLCMEEMVAYAVQIRKDREIHTQIMVSLAKDQARFMMLDDGRCTALDEVSEDHLPAISNYQFIKRIAASVEYQYVLNMNFTVIVVC